MRTPITTSLGRRTVISTDLNTFRDFGNFLMTQSLDFLMTEDNDYIVLQDSTSDIRLIRRTPITTNLA